MSANPDLLRAVIVKAAAADDALLAAMLHADIDGKLVQYTPDPKEIAMLEVRVAKYRSGAEKGYTLSEIVQRIDERRKNASL